VFRIAKDQAAHESGVFWRRELLAFAYRPMFAPAVTSLGEVEALMVIANRQSEFIRPDMTRAEQIRCIATGKGFLGTSLQYLENIAAHFEALGIEDREVDELLAGARAFSADNPAAEL
jgi:glutathione-specific gamma-glutamylcyclotransferase